MMTVLAIVLSCFLTIGSLALIGLWMRLDERKRLSKATEEIGKSTCHSCKADLETVGFMVEQTIIKTSGLFSKKIPGGIYWKVVCQGCGEVGYYDQFEYRFHSDMTRHRRGEDILNTE